MALPAEDAVLYSIIAFIVIKNVMEIYLSTRKVKVYQRSKQVPAELADAITPDIFEKERVYGQDRDQFGTSDVIIISLKFCFDFLTLVWHKSIPTVPMYWP